MIDYLFEFRSWNDQLPASLPGELAVAYTPYSIGQYFLMYPELDADIAQQWNITQTPTIIMAMDHPNGTQAICRLEGDFSQDQIMEVIENIYLGLPCNDLPSDNGQGDQGTGSGSGFGFGFNLPSLWYVVAAAAGYKAIDAKSQNKKLAFGGISAFALNKAMNQ